MSVPTRTAPALKRADLCWGQRYHWLRYQQVPPGARHDAHIVASCPLRPGVTVADLRSTLNYLIRRHEALRTVFDARSGPWPQQVVAPPAPMTLHVATTEDDGTPGPAQVVHDLTVADFDLAHDRPIRACAVTTGGTPIRLVVVLNHVAFDDWSLSAFRDEFEELVGAAVTRRRAALPPVHDQPADLARIEADQSADLDFCRDQLTRVPADMFVHRRRPGTGAHSASLTSPQLLTQAREVAGRLQVWPSAVHLAAYAVATRSWTGSDRVALRWLTSHRDASGHGAVMTCMFSPTLVLLDLSGNPTFGEVVRRTADAIAEAQTYAYVAYDQVLEAVSAEGRRRGQAVRVAADVNFLSYAPRRCGARRERLTHNPAPSAWAEAGSDVYFRIHEWSDGVTLALLAADEVMPAEAVGDFLRHCARLVADGVDQRLSGLPTTDLHTLGPDLVDPRLTEAALLAHPDVLGARLSVEPDGLVADVAVQRPVPAADLRATVLAVPGARCPVRFVLADGTTCTGTERLVEGSILTRLVAETNGLSELDSNDSYTGNGGRVLRAPGLLSRLREQGWTGVGLEDLLGLQPLRALARQLRAI